MLTITPGLDAYTESPPRLSPRGCKLSPLQSRTATQPAPSLNDGERRFVRSPPGNFCLPESHTTDERSVAIHISLCDRLNRLSLVQFLNVVIEVNFHRDHLRLQSPRLAGFGGHRRAERKFIFRPEASILLLTRTAPR